LARIKARWAAGTLHAYDRETIAHSVSWLAHDLDENHRQQQEMASLTDAGLPEQIAAHFRAGGRYSPKFLEFDDWRDEELVDPLSRIQP
jgi:hypothetical protein